MSIIQGSAKQGSTRGFYPKLINGSLRLNDDDSAYLSRTPASAGNRKTWTWSGWVKRGNLTGTEQHLFTCRVDASNDTSVWFGSDNKFYCSSNVSGGEDARVSTAMVLRDTSAWYHLVVRFDAANSSLKLYVNGVEATYSDNNQPSNVNHSINSTSLHRLGANVNNVRHFDGYLAEVHFCDGTAYDADDFGELKSGVWVAKTPSVTYGTNGFYLTFEDDTEVEAFNTVLYRGNGGTQSITGVGFQPDLLWIKNRNGTQVHQIFDAVRGVAGSLRSNATDAENIDSPNDRLLSFDSDGFSLGDDGNPNGSGNTYVAWCWKAGDSNVSNTDGTITSTVRANDTYGFSIVSYTGNGTATQTIGHGLSSAPNFVIVKNRSTAQDWAVGHTSLGWSDHLQLNTTNAATSASQVFAATAPTTSVISVGTNSKTNESGSNMIAYCWSETTGYSKFGSYTGTGSAGNSITGLGFTPAFLMVKRTDSTGYWTIMDNTRSVVGTKDELLWANAADAEVTSGGNKADFDSDGFTLQGTGVDTNASGGTYIYAAFADTREAAFWLDQSGNDNDWQPVNLDHNDTVADSPTNNFCTWNPLKKHSNANTLSDGNLKVVTYDLDDPCTFGTIGVSSGQWYWEIYPQTGNALSIGIAKDSHPVDKAVGDSSVSWGYLEDARKYHNTSATSYGSSYGAGDTIGVALDMDAGTLTFYKNGVSQGQAYSGISGTVFPAISDYASGTDTAVANFGQQPFKYDPPS